MIALAAVGRKRQFKAADSHETERSAVGVEAKRRLASESAFVSPSFHLVSDSIREYGQHHLFYPCLMCCLSIRRRTRPGCLLRIGAPVRLAAVHVPLQIEVFAVWWSPFGVRRHGYKRTTAATAHKLLLVI